MLSYVPEGKRVQAPAKAAEQPYILIAVGDTFPSAQRAVAP